MMRPLVRFKDCIPHLPGPVDWTGGFAERRRGAPWLASGRHL